MATYAQLNAAISSTGMEGLKQQIYVAIAVQAYTIAISTTPSAAAVAWAKSALGNPTQYIDLLLNYILAEYNTATIATIEGATDAQVQTAVTAAVTTLLAL